MENYIRESQDSNKLYPPRGSCMEDRDHFELENWPSNSSIQNIVKLTPETGLVPTFIAFLRMPFSAMKSVMVASLC